MVSEVTQLRPMADEVRRLVPVFALAVAVVASVTDPSSPSDLVLMAVPVAALGLWAYLPEVPVALVALAVLAPVVAVQRSGTHEPMMFEVSVLAFVVARWSVSLATAIALGLLAAASPAVVAQIETRGNISVGIWTLGIAFPWVIGRAILRQGKLSAQLDATRRELAHQAMLEERPADRAGRARLRGSWVGGGHASGHQRTARAAPGPCGDRGSAALGGGRGPSEHAGAAPNGRAAAQR